MNILIPTCGPTLEHMENLGLPEECNVYQTTTEDPLGPAHATLQLLEPLDLDVPVLVTHANRRIDWGPLSLFERLSYCADGCVICCQEGLSSDAHVRKTPQGKVEYIDQISPCGPAFSDILYMRAGEYLKMGIEHAIEDGDTTKSKYYLGSAVNRMVSAGAKITVSMVPSHRKYSNVTI